jgi:hypothetical protein
MRENPKKNPLARRKNKPRLINGIYIPADLLAEAQRRRIEKIQREAAGQSYKSLPLLTRIKIRLKILIKRLWTKMQKK